MALELVGGAAIGTGFGVLYDVVKVAAGRTVMQFKPLLRDLKFTLDSLKPRIIQQIGEHNLTLGLPNEEIESLQRQMEGGTKLIRKLSQVSMWNCSVWCSCFNCTKTSYTDQLVELDRSLRILLEILKLQEASDVKEALLLARKIHDKQDELDKKMSDLLKMQQEAAAGYMLSPQQDTKHVQEKGMKKKTEGNSVRGAALGAMFTILFGAVIQVKDKTKTFNRVLTYLKSTLDSLKPLIEEMAEYDRVLHLSKEDLENFRIEIENGVNLVQKCSKVHRWASSKRYEYTNKIAGLDESLQRLLYMLRMQLASDVRESLVSVSKLDTKISRLEVCDVVQKDQLVSKVECQIPEPEPATVGLHVLNVDGTRDVKETLDSVTDAKVDVKGIEGSEVVETGTDTKGSAVVESETDIAMSESPLLKKRDENESLDVTLMELKRKFLKDNVPALVITGPGGGGKTALADKFCQDGEVQDIFKSNIFFVPVSKEPNLEFLNWMRGFLKETGQHPSLLVLDDVWSESESIIDKFDELKMLNYKILVTSRFEFPKFGSPIYLKSLNEEDITFEASPTILHHCETSSLVDENSFFDDSKSSSFFDEGGYLDDSTTFLGNVSSFHQKRYLASKQQLWKNLGKKALQAPTSSAAFPKFGSPFYLKSLNEEDITFEASPTILHHCETSSLVDENSFSDDSESSSFFDEGGDLDDSTTFSGNASSFHQKRYLASKQELWKNLGTKALQAPTSSPAFPSQIFDWMSNSSDHPLSSFSSGIGTSEEYIRSSGPDGAPKPHYLHYSTQSPQDYVTNKNADDGFIWRKYGHKQVSGSKNLRSYYRCTYPNCPTKKKVERSSMDGQVTEILYQRNHNHPKPSGLATCQPIQASSDKERDEENANDETFPGSGSETVKARVVGVKTTSETGIPDDGYKWRKYGTKVMKGNPNPRSFYKCVFEGCLARKHVERSSHDLRVVTSTYEGVHNHDHHFHVLY